MPASTEPSVNTMRASCSSTFLFVRSASLPQTGVEIAEVSVVAKTTQVKLACVPPMSAMMRGIEVPTTFIASIETKLLMKIAARARFLVRPVSTSGTEAVTGGWVASAACDIPWVSSVGARMTARAFARAH